MTTVDFTDRILDTTDTSVVKIILHNPATQQEIIDEINSKEESTSASTSNGPMVIAIPFNWHLKQFDEISDNVCQRLEGLFVYGVVNIHKPSLLAFIKRCPNLKALTLMDFGDDQYRDADESFPKQVFSSGAVPNLEFFEGYIAADSTIGAMASSPNLQVIVFSEPHNYVSNEGFRLLVKAGGGKRLHSIQAGTLVKEQSKTLCTSSLNSILCNHRTSNIRLTMTHMPNSLRPLPQDSEPYAVVPLERMNVKQLRATLQKRGIPIPKRALKDNFVKALEDDGFDLQEEAAIQARAEMMKLNLTKPSGYQAKVAKLQNIYDAYYVNNKKRKTGDDGSCGATCSSVAASGSNKERKVLGTINWSSSSCIIVIPTICSLYEYENASLKLAVARIS